LPGTGYLQKGHSTRLNTTFKRHLQQMKVAMKSIWTGEPNEKQREQRDFVLRQREQRHTEARVLRAFSLLSCFASET
jgi:hypothetical protein